MTPDWFQRLTKRPERDPVLAEWLSSPEIESLFSTGDGLAILPVGATEQHGPHLPINTDTLIATSVCMLASAETDALILPALSYGVSLGHTEKWAGTFSLYHETLIHSVREIATWFVATGGKRLLIVNAHCGNDASLRCAVDRLRFDFPNRLHVAMRNTWQLTPSIAAQFSADASDWHANAAETGLVRFLEPKAVREVAADDPDRTAACVFPHMVAHTSINGVTGTPSLGTAEQGAALIAEMGGALADIIRAARADATPLSWERTSSAFAA